jgi:hypothetical protein
MKTENLEVSNSNQMKRKNGKETGNNYVSSGGEYKDG